MSLEAIAELPIGDLLTADAVVWLWTTDRFLKDALVIATEQWSLELRKIVVWDKLRAGRPTPWLRGQTEYCLLLTRGNPIFESAGFTNLIRERAREHSRSPMPSTGWLGRRARRTEARDVRARAPRGLRAVGRRD